MYDILVLPTSQKKPVWEEATIHQIDALIAATAAIHRATLVHRDPHLATIPPQHLRQIYLAAS